MTQDVPLTIAFLAGIFSFLSPCVLPIVPGFISYILGKSFSDLEGSSVLNKLKIFHFNYGYFWITKRFEKFIWFIFIFLSFRKLEL